MIKLEEKGIKLEGQLDGSDQDNIIGEAAKSGQQNILVKNGTVDRETTVIISGSIPKTKEITVKVQTLERRFNEGIDTEMGEINDLVEDRIQNAILTAVDTSVTPRPVSAVRSINAFFGRGVASITAHSEREGHKGNTASFWNVSKKSNTFLNKTRMVRLGKHPRQGK